MDKKNLELIKIQVSEHLAPIHEGTISLREVFRIFSHIGDKRDIEKCLDQLVDNKNVKKMEQNNEVYYVFQEIALQFGKKWKQEIVRLKNNIAITEQEVNRLSDILEKNQTLKEIWFHNWGNDETSKIMPNLISRYFRQEQLATVKQINANIDTNKKNQKQLSTTEQKLTLSFMDKSA